MVDRERRPRPAPRPWLREGVGAPRAPGRDAGRRRSRRPASGVPRRSASDGLVHLFGAGHSRIPVEEMFPRYGSYPGFNPIVELSVTFHTQVVGANGQRQAMFIERMPGLAEVILSNFTFGPQRRDDGVLGERPVGAAGRDGARSEGARPARDRGHVRGPVDVRGTRARRRRPAPGGRRPRARRLHAGTRTRW